MSDTASPLSRLHSNPRWVKVKVTQSFPTLCDPVDYTQSVEISRPEYCSGQPFPSPGDLPNPGIEPRSPALQADSLPAELQGKPNARWGGGEINTSTNKQDARFPSSFWDPGLWSSHCHEHCRSLWCRGKGALRDLT